MSSRQAILRSKKKVDEQEKRDREELFGLGNKRMNGKSFTEQYELKQRGVQRGQQDEAVLRTSSDVTEALKRTSTLMQQELEKSTFSASMLGKLNNNKLICINNNKFLNNYLAESSKTLSSTYTEYQNLSSLVNISKRVITQLEASDWFDRLLLLFGLLLFSFVVLYIIKKRTYDVGISWVSWLTQTKKSKIPATTIEVLTTTTVSIISATVSPVVNVIKDEL